VLRNHYEESGNLWISFFQCYQHNHNRNHNPNLRTSEAPLESQMQSTSLLTSM